MPVPTVAAPSLTPPPEINPRLAGEPGRAAAGAAEQLGALDEFGERATDLLRKAQDQGIMLDAENKIGADMEHAETQLTAWTDYTNADQLKQQTADTLQEKYAEKYGTRPDIWRQVQPYLDRQLNSYNAVVDRRTAVLTMDFNKGALFDSQLRAENEAATEPTIDGKEIIWGIQDDKTDAMVRNGTIEYSAGEVAKKQLRSRTIAAEVERAANPMNAPEIMESEMERLKEYEGKGYVDPKELEQMQEHLGVSYERALNRSDRVEVTKQGDAVLSSLKNDPTNKDPETREFDPLAAAKKMDDNPDIPNKVKKYARQELEEQAGVQTKLTNERDQKMLDELDPNVESGKLTSAELTRRENLAPGSKDWIPRRVADHLLSKSEQLQRENRVESMQERGLLRQERMDKSAEIRDQLLADPGYISDEKELTPYRLKGLSPGDANIVWKARAINGDPAWKMAVSMMQNSTVYDKETDEGRAKLTKDMIGFAKTVENKKLTGSQITDELQKELHPQEESIHNQTVKTLLDNIWPIAKSVFTEGLIDPADIKVPANGEAPQRPKTVPDNAVWNGEAKQWQLPKSQ